MKKIILSLFLIMILSFTPVYESYADAGTITIAGGSIGVAGLGAAGLAGLTGPVVVAVFCGLMAVGLDVELTKQSEAAGMTKTQFVQSKIEQYCNEAQITLGVFNKAILEGMTVLNDGRISLTDQACKQIKQFGNWLFNNNQVVETSDISSGTVCNLDGKQFPLLVNGNKYEMFTLQNGTKYYVGDISIISGENIFLGLGVAGSSFCARFFSESPFKVQYRFYFGDDPRILVTQSNNGIRNGVYYSNHSTYNQANNITAVTPVFNESMLDLVTNGLDISGGGVADNTFTGSRDDWASGSNVLDPVAGQTTIINPNITIPTTADKDLTIDVQEYLEAIQKVLDKLQDITIPAVDDTDGIPTEIDIPDETVIDPTIEKEEDTDIPDPDDTTPVINDEDTPVGPAAVEPLKFDLRNIFPFCIPFDVRDMISMLSAEPEAPRYHVTWEIPWINENLEFTVDLSEFDDVAAICRKMELLLFVVGLAVVTRSMFIRS